MSKPETTILIFGTRRGIVNVADVPAFIEGGIARAVDETKFPEGYMAIVEPLPAGVEPLGPDEKRNEILTHRDGSEVEINHQMRTAGREIYVATCSDAIGRRMVETVVVGHASDCAVHNMPYKPNGPCDCGIEGKDTRKLECTGCKESKDRNEFATPDLCSKCFMAETPAPLPLAIVEPPASPSPDPAPQAPSPPSVESLPPPSPMAAGGDSSPEAPQGVIPLAAPLPNVAGRPRAVAPRGGKDFPSPSKG
jgi:hypothetical protein